MRANGATRLLAATAALACLGGAAAAGQFPVPGGCTAFVTVQLRGCQVSQHYTCEADAPGTQWAIYADAEGPHFASKIDAETRWVLSFDLTTGETDRLIEEADAASLSELLETGVDALDFTTESNRGEVRRYVGEDRLTGEVVTIDGEPLEQTEFELTAFDGEGEMVWRREGRQFIHRGWRLFFGDREAFQNRFGDTAETVDTPVRFSHPGEAGFLDADPVYDCEITLTELRP